MTALLECGVRGFGEALALLGRHGPGAREVRAAGVLGAHVPWAADNHWADAAVVLEGSAAGERSSAESLPHCVWARAEQLPGRQATATLLASPDGRALYEQLGFRTVGTLRAHLAG